ncbi:E3 ubiquitin-protein ligase TRIM11-like [Hyperolius riggenbachi]|uniref:E3 ubiquitin-protein ligase TRIM11-like n=1 Tax=Hyperolius riggenbachi TaxID=752182 RepID=UPI0035A27DA1
MASAGVRAELECSVCLNIYNDPVSLTCGHSFCRVCIDRVLDTQEGSGRYSCPDCRATYDTRPALQRNFALYNVVENVRPTQPDQEENTIFCSNCVDSPAPAVKSCLHCEVSLCDKHLRVHSKAPQHVLCDPTTSLENRRCSIHLEPLRYFCTEDSACICVSCSLAGEHRGHQVETLEEASMEKKGKLRNDLQELITVKREMEKRVQSLKNHQRKAQEKAAGETERVTALFRDFRRHLENLERRVLSDITNQAHGYDDVIRQLEIKEEELTRKMRHIEELCHMTDPLTVLQEPDTGDLCDTEEETRDQQLHDGWDVVEMQILHTLHTGLSHLMEGVNESFNIQEAADLLLDVDTANNRVHVSPDRKTASKSSNQEHPDTPQRFQNEPQVLSRQSFSSGRHYWDVSVGWSKRWRVGVCYPSIARRADQVGIGYDKNSWVLGRHTSFKSWVAVFLNDFIRAPKHEYFVTHDGEEIPLSDSIPRNKVRICLDYEAGRISFYDLCDPIRHLHTFTAAFTEPLHAVFQVGNGHIQLCGGN